MSFIWHTTQSTSKNLLINPKWCLPKESWCETNLLVIVGYVG